MAGYRWKIISVSVGGAILLLMLLASSFSLGVYVGEHGWTRDGLNYSGPGKGGQGGANDRPAQVGPAPATTQQVPQAPAGLPSGKPNLTGRILRVHPQSVEVTSPNGPRVVTITSETRFLEQDGRIIGLKDLLKGDVVAVYGRFMGGDGGELQADFIVRLPPKE
jgi:hypothetical protein